jgi:transglutaminase-like putative cysteine protease
VTASAGPGERALRPPGTPRQPAVLLAVFLAALLAGAAGTSFQRVFGLAPLAPVLAVAAIVPAALCALWSTGRRRLPLWAAIPASMACWFLVAGATVARGTELGGVLPTARTIATIRSGVSDSWWQMLTTILPAPATPELILGVHLLVWLGSMAAAEIVLRTRRVLPALLPAACILLAGIALGVDGPGSDILSAGAVLLLAGLLVAVREAWSGEAEDGLAGRAWRHAATGTAIAAVITVLATMAGPWLPLASARAPFDPRRYVHPAASVQTLTSPLDYVSLWLAEPRVPLFRVSASAPQDWRLAVLDTFDGQTWTDSGSFSDTGGRVPQAQGNGGVAGPAVTQTVTIQNLAGTWLPAADRPAMITGVPASVDPATGVLLDRAPLTSGARYRIVSHSPASSTAELSGATVAAGSAHADLALPAPVPSVITSTAQAATAGAASPVEQAVMLASYLFQNEEFDPAAPPGHSYGSVSYFLGVSHRGTSEQFATAYALMARSLGLPSRLVVGFRPGTKVALGTWQVNGTDALVWPEVDFARIGWVAFYPTPAGPGRGSARSVPAGQTVAQHNLDQQIASAGRQPVRGGPERGPASHGHHVPGPGQRSPWPAVCTAVAIMLTAGYLGCVILIPWWRRRRRRRGDPGAQVVGAWLETVASLRDCGVRPGPAKSAPEVAELGVGRLGSAALPALLSLAALADYATFAPGPLAEDAAGQAWQHCEQVRQAVRARTTWRRRLLTLLSPARV